MKQANEKKLANLNKQQQDIESTLKSHRRELEVSSY